MFLANPCNNGRVYIGKRDFLMVIHPLAPDQTSLTSDHHLLQLIQEAYLSSLHKLSKAMLKRHYEEWYLFLRYFRLLRREEE